MASKKKMNPRVKKLWIAALRSGEYRQGRKKLRNERNSFCCLGVLCNIHAQEHPEIAVTQTDPEVYLGQTAVLPIEVSDWANIGLVGEFGSVNKNLATLNDQGKSFEELANVIARNF